ncbi:Nucleic acid-binding OB-fold [Penicillium cf. griseofulvum]|uniref:CST complex subunit STN1 n=1 Tax=Penicillium cf. griseofulvum TaxID=2972120 RepID=A0A9W9M5G2_9EURO|nr:Nucleic acid-binding OB-fold [Penicillium cf. griseofulvum]KAJ5435330.1 Nucleic acid-binding OB-fold [Penicillium cf. griseofulvum]KAJ5453161.1 Nucleic acid-binding OB-fold [Penicillium cf. griseofulvum]
MATVNNENLVFYPAFCFKASPTHFTWVKMSAADVHRLRGSSNFVGQNIFFYNNHPIQFVSLVGVIVARTDFPWRTILTLDDSSGATIDIAVLKKTTKTETTSQETPATDPEQTEWSSFSLTAPTAKSLAQTTHITSKDRDEIDISALQPGTLVRVKGTLSTFRSQMQLYLERFWLVRDTNAEMQFLDTRLRFLVEVLSVPWVLTDEEVEKLRDDAERCDERVLEDKRRAERAARKRTEREERHARAIARRYEKEENERERELREIREDGKRVMRKFGFGAG